MFKRRNPKGFTRSLVEFFYPRGGWGRASRYIVYRLRRLPDPAHKISRGIACGVFASFTPFYGFHFITAGLVAWAIRGNILAALLATFFGNPITFPIIATISVNLGTWMLGFPRVPGNEILSGFSHASVELWGNFAALFTSATADWTHMSRFFTRVFLPYLVGGLIPGIIAGFAVYFMANPIIASYQRGRIAKVKERFEARRKAAEAERARRQREGADTSRGKRDKDNPSRPAPTAGE